ncbi:MAG: hypothetical protein Q8P90_03060 [bacterium]|nr:hypothetical protein [bacterium]
MCAHREGKLARLPQKDSGDEVGISDERAESLSDAARNEGEIVEDGDYAEVRASFVEMGRESANQMIIDSYVIADPERPEDVLEAHNPAHTDGVVERGVVTKPENKEAGQKGILDVVLDRATGFTDEQKQYIKDTYVIIASHHDVVQDWHEMPKWFDGGTQRQREGGREEGKNEWASAEAAIGYMKSANKEVGFELFDPGDDDEKPFGYVHRIMDATVPGWDGKTVVQPHLLEEIKQAAENDKENPPTQSEKAIRLLMVTLALADLGEAGMAGTDVFKDSGNRNFREEKLNVQRAINEAGSIVAIPEAQREIIIKQILMWTGDLDKQNGQISFAMGQRDNLENILSFIPDDETMQGTRDAVKALFNKFDESIQGAIDEARARQSMSFEELMDRVGYQDPVNSNTE